MQNASVLLVKKMHNAQVDLKGIMAVKDKFVTREVAILDSINEGVFTVDLDWRITTFNRAAEQITGVPREEALGRACCDVFHADVCETDCTLRRTLSLGKPLMNRTAHIVNHEGQRIPIRISTALLTNEVGEIVGGVETFQDLTQLERLQKELESRYTFEDIVGRSKVMAELFDLLPQIADSTSTVLIEGSSGTGKELFARAIHNLSPRRNKPFIAVNCGALPDSLLESELFGHKAGAFTDARRDKPGRFQLAHGGTIFLDEIGDISSAMQVGLLRVLQERVIEPLGSIESVPVDVRVIAATNRNLLDLMRNGKFREDLYYRIRVIHLELPSLAERREDIPLLIDHLINKYNSLQNKKIVGATPEVMAVLMDHDYPGNIRELENIIEQAFVLCREGIIQLHHLPRELRPQHNNKATDASSLNLEDMEKLQIMHALEVNKGNRTKAASDLGIDVSTLYRKIKKYNLDVPEVDGRSNRS